MVARCHRPRGNVALSLSALVDVTGASPSSSAERTSSVSSTLNGAPSSRSAAATVLGCIAAMSIAGDATAARSVASRSHSASTSGAALSSNTSARSSCASPASSASHDSASARRRRRASAVAAVVGASAAQDRRRRHAWAPRPWRERAQAPPRSGRARRAALGVVGEQLVARGADVGAALERRSAVAARRRSASCASPAT